ncbi:hypothetical protein OAB57_04040, partial [Bacteriovoracaceae bacterium]|nr:hypothetical protein [Bacteriovoracaceae bacterium]
GVNKSEFRKLYDQESYREELFKLFELYLPEVHPPIKKRSIVLYDLILSGLSLSPIKKLVKEFYKEKRGVDMEVKTVAYTIQGNVAALEHGVPGMGLSEEAAKKILNINDVLAYSKKSRKERESIKEKPQLNEPQQLLCSRALALAKEHFSAEHFGFDEVISIPELLNSPLGRTSYLLERGKFKNLSKYPTFPLFKKLESDEKVSIPEVKTRPEYHSLMKFLHKNKESNLKE